MNKVEDYYYLTSEPTTKLQQSKQHGIDVKLHQSINKTKESLKIDSHTRPSDFQQRQLI